MNAARLAQFRRVLAAALETKQYRPWLEAASLGTVRQIARLNSIEETLRRLPPLKAELYRGQPELVRSRQRHNLCRWEHTEGRTMRTAVLAEVVRGGTAARVFANGLGRRLKWYRPEAVAGSPERLRQLALAWERCGAKESPRVQAVIIIRRPWDPPLGEAEREQLWRAFEAPLFERWLGEAGELLAWECEAHQGLHLAEETAVFETECVEDGEILLVTSLVNLRLPMLRLRTGRRGRVARDFCPCGQPALRWLEEELCLEDRMAEESSTASMLR